MSENEFFRAPTLDEKKDFIDIGPSRGKDCKTRFLDELAHKRAEAGAKKLPFFKKAAMDDFDEYYKEAVKVSMRKNGYVKIDEIKPLKMDWAKYSSKDSIRLVETVEQYDSNLSKKYPFQVFLKAFRYKYAGYGQEGVPNMSIMEDEEYGIKRAKAKYDNVVMPKEISLAEQVSKSY